jgi:wyosine [tRNA(Phe)-imidazoG37] synthetase (radical SAM superfamily)
MDANQGEIWAKLDAGTEDYYRLINRPNYPLNHVIDNITAAARVRPVVIQSIFMRVHGDPPSDAELSAYVDRLKEITSAGGRIRYVQVYTIARRPAESWVTPLTNDEVDGITMRVQTGTGLPAESYYSGQ